MASEIKITNNEKKKQLEYKEGGKTARLQYGFYKDNIAFTHMDVPKSLSGKGIASALTEFAFDYAKSINKKVMVYCGFVGSYAAKHPELRAQMDKKYHPY